MCVLCFLFFCCFFLLLLRLLLLLLLLLLIVSRFFCVNFQLTFRFSRLQTCVSVCCVVFAAKSLLLAPRSLSPSRLYVASSLASYKLLKPTLAIKKWLLRLTKIVVKSIEQSGKSKKFYELGAKVVCVLCCATCHIASLLWAAITVTAADSRYTHKHTLHTQHTHEHTRKDINALFTSRKSLILQTTSGNACCR